MKKIRDEYPVEFIDRLTEEFISGGMALGKEDRVRAEILKIRAKNHSALFLEMYFAVINIQLEDAMIALRMLTKVMEDDDIFIALYQKEADLADAMLAYHQGKSVAVAKSGGDGRAAKLKDLEKETIRLYRIKLEHRESTLSLHTERKRTSIPLDAQEITPLIVELSKKNGVNLLPTTTKPLAWMRAFAKSQKSSAS